MSPITAKRAAEAVQRLINSHFGNANRARVSIPAQPADDDDLVAYTYVKESADYITALEAELSRLKWQPITPENLPKVGDEVMRCTRGVIDQMKYGGPYAVLNVTALYCWNDTTAQEFADGGWTHFRPINPPQTDGAA